jgi:hypothetical protein
MYNLLYLSKCLHFFPIVQLWISCDYHDINNDYFPKRHYSFGFYNGDASVIIYIIHMKRQHTSET